MLFAFLHAEAKHVKAGCRNAVQDLPHPKEYDGTDEEWRTLALEHALQLRLDLAWQQKERGDFKKASLSENDYTGCVFARAAARASVSYIFLRNIDSPATYSANNLFRFSYPQYAFSGHIFDQ